MDDVFVQLNSNIIKKKYFKNLKKCFFLSFFVKGDLWD